MNRTLFLLFAVTLFLTGETFAQDYAIDKGSFILGGSANFTSQGGDLYEADDERLTSIGLNPLLLYFVLPGFGIGGDLLINRVSQGDFSQTSLAVGPTIAYFFGNSESKVFPFVSASPLFSSTSVDVGDEDISGSGFGFSGEAGAAFMLARNVAITGGVFYLYEKIDIDEFDESLNGNTVGVALGITAFIY